MKASIILIDPPWAFKVWSKDTGQGRSAESHYGTMDNDDLLKLNIQQVAAENCALFMWATFPTLPFALECGKAWGFNYKTTAFLWAKTVKSTNGRFIHDISDNANWHLGMGYVTRANAEPCLYFTRGKPKRVNAGVRQLVVHPVLAHSEKPLVVHQKIETLMGTNHTFLEIFARRCPESFSYWTFLGNEVTGNDIREDLRLYAERT